MLSCLGSGTEPLTIPLLTREHVASPEGHCSLHILPWYSTVGLAYPASTTILLHRTFQFGHSTSVLLHLAHLLQPIVRDAILLVAVLVLATTLIMAPLVAPVILLRRLALLQGVVPKRATHLVSILTEEPKDVPVVAKVVLLVVLACLLGPVVINTARFVVVFATRFAVVPTFTPVVLLVVEALLEQDAVNVAA
jgi:hypothetical protein